MLDIPTRESVEAHTGPFLGLYAGTQAFQTESDTHGNRIVTCTPQVFFVFLQATPHQCDATLCKLLTSVVRWQRGQRSMASLFS
jgi:hypothetical protein